ncbi:MAG: hypothetical protein RLZZ387_4142 [Chloroflexota bacterium]|jgi:DNA-binding XRE family transcriptional regulator
MTTSQGGTYLRVLRDRLRLKQEEFGTILGANRNTVMKMERDTESTRHMTVMHAIAALHASAGSYCELVVDAGVTVEQVLNRHAVLEGLHAYAYVIAQHRGLVGDATHWAGHALAAQLGLHNPVQPTINITEFSLLMLIIVLDVSLVDLTEIISATDDHVALGEHLASERIAFGTPHYTDLVIPARDLEQVPLLASALRRLSQIKRYSEQQRMLHYEAELAISDIQHFLSHFFSLIKRSAST